MMAARKVKGQVDAISTAGEREMARWRATVAACWRNACAWEGIAPDAPAVVFSPTNPVARFYDIALRRAQEAERDLYVLGYRGLVIAGGRARLGTRGDKERAGG